MLCGFLVAHLAGNMLFYVPDGYASYNDYAHAIHANPLLPVAEIVLYALFIAHIVYTIRIVLANRAARPQGYAVKRSKRGKSALTPHNVMHVSGLIVLAFLVLHLLDLRFDVRFPAEAYATPAARALAVLADPLSATLYTIGSLLLGYHLWHGFRSGFQTIGANHPRVNNAIKLLGIVFAITIALGFASFPVWGLLFLR
jgi:succinate dehydrogenase / fumarate reductase cytochrome b subunit